MTHAIEERYNDLLSDFDPDHDIFITGWTDGGVKITIINCRYWQYV